MDRRLTLSDLPFPMRIVTVLLAIVFVIVANAHRPHSTWRKLARMTSSQEQAEGAPKASSHHDPTAHAPSEAPTRTDSDAGHLGAWTAVAAGGAGLSVLLAGFGLFSLFGGSKEPDGDADPLDGLS